MQLRITMDKDGSQPSLRVNDIDETVPGGQTAEARIRREEAYPERRREMVDGDQAEGEKAPIDEGMSEAGKRALFDHLPLEHHFPQKLPDTRP